jgi:hypothetical protein
VQDDARDDRPEREGDSVRLVPVVNSFVPVIFSFHRETLRIEKVDEPSI